MYELGVVPHHSPTRPARSDTGALTPVGAGTIHEARGRHAPKRPFIRPVRPGAEGGRTVCVAVVAHADGLVVVSSEHAAMRAVREPLHAAGLRHVG